MKKMRMGKAMPILWTENWRRISSLFIRETTEGISIHSIPYGFDVTCQGDETPASLREKLAKALANKPVGDTEKIIAGLK